MRTHELGRVTQYDKLLRLQQVVEDADFQTALAQLDHMVSVDEEGFESKFAEITGVFADVAARYGASPEELDTAIELTRAATDAE